MLENYPVCPLCGGPVVAATMTGRAIYEDGTKYQPGRMEGLFYHPEDLSVYCCNGSCTWGEHKLSTLTSPPK
jgi:hypothetical protein